MAPFLPRKILGSIKSIECLSETVENGGRPCEPRNEEANAPGQAQSKKAETKAREMQPDPSLRHKVITRGKAHHQQSVTLVRQSPLKVDVSTPVAHARLRAHHHAHHVTQVITQ